LSGLGEIAVFGQIQLIFSLGQTVDAYLVGSTVLDEALVD
jgi:hypothetical protein